ncbi:MAG: 2-amino-4-hydroxy-6-hydroxymethyldihydropteridine diphosphokinase [Caulobacteraceae bacterium]|nr:2-amino-4-hydroxy-6-hydroxymethyldihydropteridine diphosphokinase [Caulobacteraceae bacterium]
MYENAVLIALGSSLGGRFGSSAAVVSAAVDQLAGAGFQILARSSLWRSASWPDPTQPDYINALVIVETPLGPAQTLARLHEIEAVFGRERGVANAPRVLDLDLIAHGRTVSGEAGLLLPHPRAAERLFVMGPLAEIAPGWRHPVSGETAAALAAGASVGRDATPI